MNHSSVEVIPERETNQGTKQQVSIEDIYKKLLELEVQVKKIEERISKPLIG